MPTVLIDFFHVLNYGKKGQQRRGKIGRLILEGVSEKRIFNYYIDMLHEQKPIYDKLLKGKWTKWAVLLEDNSLFHIDPDRTLMKSVIAKAKKYKVDSARVDYGIRVLALDTETANMEKLRREKRKTRTSTSGKSTEKPRLYSIKF